MAALSHSALLQALGWATLNSFWQMALLWGLVSVGTAIFRLSSNQKYILSVTAIGVGFAWFVFTLIQYQLHSASYILSFTSAALSYPFIDTIVTAASVTYLCLLFIPAYRLLKNWQHIQKLRTQHLHKAGFSYRLFVQKIAVQLGIKKTVQVYLSDLVKSPVTIGYIKPVILLPIAAMNQLTLPQAEAVLLHELSHIKRYDYLINVAVTIISTLLYFNPFLKLLIRNIEAERENCCDELVLQFEYDKVSYAAALLALEKNAQSLLLAATGKKHLLHRIEKIVGMERKPIFNINQAIGIFAAFLFVLLVNAVLMVGKKEQTGDSEIVFTQLANPFFFLDEGGNNKEDVQLQTEKARMLETIALTETKPATIEVEAPKTTAAQEMMVPPPPPPPDPGPVSDNSNRLQPAMAPVTNVDIVPVTYNLADAALSAEQKAQVKQTVAATKKILAGQQWKEVENQIADGMTEHEKQIAKQEYLLEVEKINWQQLENNLKAGYNHIDWNNLNNTIYSALTVMKLDSLQAVYDQVIVQANKAKADSAACQLAYPDVTLKQLNTIKAEAEKRIKVIEAIRNKKVVHL